MYTTNGCRWPAVLPAVLQTTRFLPPVDRIGSGRVSDAVTCGAPVYTPVLPAPAPVVTPPPVVTPAPVVTPPPAVIPPPCRRTTGDICRDLTEGLAVQSEFTAAERWDCAQRGFSGVGVMDLATLRAVQAGLAHPLRGGARCLDAAAGLGFFGGDFVHSISLGAAAAIGSAVAAVLVHQFIRRRRSGRALARVRGAS